MPKQAKPDLSVWTTREGSKVVVVEMEDSHLSNLISYLQKRVEELTLVTKSDNRVLSEVAIMKIEGHLRWIDHLEAEQVRRLSVEANTLVEVPLGERYV